MKINNKLIEKNIITAGFSNFTSKGNLAPITGLTLLSQSGNKLTLQNDGIKIGSTVSKVLISGWAFNNTNANGAGFIGGITLNGTGVQSFWQKSNSANDNITMSLPATMINVQENDVINFGVGINGDTSHVFNRGTVTVEVVE